MARDINAEVQDHLGLCEALAVTLVQPGNRGINGVEFDDLVQEGLIAVWQGLAAGVLVSKKVIRGRMVSYMRWLGNNKNLPYELAQPLEDYRETLSRREV